MLRPAAMETEARACQGVNVRGAVLCISTPFTGVKNGALSCALKPYEALALKDTRGDPAATAPVIECVVTRSGV
jgi:hypothetical protein